MRMSRRAQATKRSGPASPAERAQWDAVPTTYPTARPWRTVAALIPFPARVAGLGVVDVGAGGSDAVATLLAAGADAVAVDPRYRSLPGLVRDANAYFGAQQAAGRPPHSREDAATAIAEQREAFRRFVASFQGRHRNRYVAAVATALPLQDGSADLVYSLDCITQYLDRDYDVLQAAVQEALRVLRPGGLLALVPFRDEVFRLGYHDVRRASQERLLDWIEERGLVWRLDDLSPGGLTRSCRLVVSAP